MNAPHGFDLRRYRRVLGAFPTGVTVVTTLAPGGEPVGITVNSFASLSLEPPLVLWALNVRSPKLAIFDRAERFAVNVLAEDQVELSRRFASRDPDPFAGVPTRPGLGGIPLLAGVIAHIQCRGPRKPRRRRPRDPRRPRRGPRPRGEGSATRFLGRPLPLRGRRDRLTGGPRAGKFHAARVIGRAPPEAMPAAGRPLASGDGRNTFPQAAR
ncbi:MAG: flavin reductase family protein [Burkholderiales bacterium]|nr:flavin reductase family protein [Burkholderiales bacterium]